MQSNFGLSDVSKQIILSKVQLCGPFFNLNFFGKIEFQPSEFVSSFFRGSYMHYHYVEL